MSKPTDVRPVGAKLMFLPVETRVPLKFGPETLTYVTCARACVRVRDAAGREAEGWGETPLSVQWAWPSGLSYEERHETMKHFCEMLAKAWAEFDEVGHPIEVGHAFAERRLVELLETLNEDRPATERMPWLAALICCSTFDVALHDAYGQCLNMPVYETYTEEFMNRDLSSYLETAHGTAVSFEHAFPNEFLVADPPARLPAWHLVGGKDLLSAQELTGAEPDDGYPVLLPDWIERDGLTCLKVKLRGNDAEWDYARLVHVGEIGIDKGVLWLTSDFNCTVEHPDYVNAILDKLMID